MSRAHNTEPARQLAETALRTASKNAPTSKISAGISSGSWTSSSASTAYTEARRALHVARSVPRLSPIARWDDIGAYRTLTAIRDPDSQDNVIDPRVRLLHQHLELARTAEEFLDRAGDVQATANQLIIHRSTLYQRLSRIHDLCDLDLPRSGEDRLITHIGLRLLRLAST